MNKYCSDCTFLNTADAKCEGVYKCSKIKEYTNACKTACDQFEKSYGRNSYEKERLYELGKKEANKPDDIPISNYIFVLIMLAIAFGIAKLFGY